MIDYCMNSIKYYIVCWNILICCWKLKINYLKIKLKWDIGNLCKDYVFRIMEDFIYYKLMF